ncbi:MAG: Sporulation protein [Gemmatimonadetes bacterium]|nr:Sporulation protein [Gemmatimonadota bacterium]
MVDHSRIDWEAEGRRLGEGLDFASAVVVLGDDAESTAWVAVGIARTQCSRRRVALGDLLGDAYPIASLVSGEDDDPHGLVDSFLFGVSLNRIARPTQESEELFVMPSGSDLSRIEELLSHERWARLAAGFREAGALLVLVARADAPDIEMLVAHTDGAVLVGEKVPAALPVSRVLASVRSSRGIEPAVTRSAHSGYDDAVPEAVPAIASEHAPRTEKPARARPKPRSSARPSLRTLQRWQAWSLGSVAVLVLAGITFWFARRPFASAPLGEHQRVKPDTGSSNAIRLTDGAPAPQLPVVKNPEDSISAAAWSVELTNLNTPAGAILKAREMREAVPAGTFAPVQYQGAVWYSIRGGAYGSASEAESLLATLRKSGVVEAGFGKVIRAPLAFLLADSLAELDVAARLAPFAAHDLPVYALQQQDGSVKLYAGAFETPAQSILLIDALLAAGIAPSLVFRTGRVF